MGVGSILAIRFLLQSEEANLGLIGNIDAEISLLGLFLLYGTNGFKILAGVLGLFLANKKSLLTVLFGILLFAAQLVGFLQVGNDLAAIIIHIVLLVIPYYYLHNAVRNFRG